jgi:nucleoside 2-deoxyribosyltransferase
MKEKLVYLAGSIKGLTYGDCTSWREYAIEELRKYGIRGLSPMRAKKHLDNGKILMFPDNRALSCSRGIITRDRWDVTRCDIMLANLLNAQNVSIGTIFEYAWADAFRKPIISVIEKEGNVHDHPMIQEATGFRVETLEEGIHVARALLDYES